VVEGRMRKTIEDAKAKEEKRQKGSIAGRSLLEKERKSKEWEKKRITQRIGPRVVSHFQTFGTGRFREKTGSGFFRGGTSPKKKRKIGELFEDLKGGKCHREKAIRNG